MIYYLFGSITVAQYNLNYNVDDIDFKYSVHVYAFDRGSSDPTHLLDLLQTYGDFCEISKSDFELIKQKQNDN
jgi:hypothetical protein